ncbi:MAG TPA: hypothetical protein VM597_33060 [Gemmataceae bacterium]|jgi:hypothetical protein|nr:hypothetical protein [Gemmataceae bacterium]
MTPYLMNPVFIVFASITLIALGTTFGNFWYRTKRAALEAELKLEMIRQGMSADEICRVIRVRPGQADDPVGCGRRSRQTADV